MKKSIAYILLLAGLIAQARQPEKVYRGFVDINTSVRSHKYFSAPTKDYRETIGFVGFSTSHGYQLNRNLFLGAGLDIEYNSTYDTWLIPLFFDARTDLQFNRFTPFADIRIGYNLTDRCGLYFNPTLGYRFDWGKRCGLNIGVGFTLQYYKYEKFDFAGSSDTDKNFVYLGTARGNKVYFSARIGIDF